MTDRRIEDSVSEAAAAWKSSPYYANAERLLHIFWDESTVFYRLFQSLDLTDVIELACGHGRHAERIIDRVERLTLIDIHQENIEATQRRLADYQGLRFIVNNGYDFQPVEDSSVTAIYCYDAMVHFPPDVVESYVSDTTRVLREGGLALYHHSNYGDAPGRHYGLNPHARNHMTQEQFLAYARNAGLQAVESTMIRWGGHPNLDCVSLLAKP